MPERCHACGEITDISFVKRIKEEGSDCAVYECTKCKSITVKGSITESSLRAMVFKLDTPWHFNEERDEFLCVYENRRIVKPITRGWRCEECWRECIYTPHLGKATFSFSRRRI
jgi:hypothetical protein